MIEIGVNKDGRSFKDVVSNEGDNVCVIHSGALNTKEIIGYATNVELTEKGFKADKIRLGELSAIVQRG